jgi:hypothetical protein
MAKTTEKNDPATDTQAQEPTPVVVVSTDPKAMLDAMPKVRVRIPEDPKDKSPVFVGYNGHGMGINRGVFVEVPQVIADILAESGYI